MVTNNARGNGEGTLLVIYNRLFLSGATYPRDSSPRPHSECDGQNPAGSPKTTRMGIALLMKSFCSSKNTHTHTHENQNTSIPHTLSSDCC
mmetsp:Transcript_24156/g.56367  ORF Transcript_24156/g.56367 Transcript_24156/m.56367 type:complete len:91 (+) Transcript_24156:72-344(+)